MINGDAPQIKVKALEALLVETECREGGGKYNRQGQISRAENRKGEVKSLPFFYPTGRCLLLEKHLGCLKPENPSTPRAIRGNIQKRGQ